MKKRSKNLISLIALLAMLCIGYAAVSFGAPTHNIKWTKHNLGMTQKSVGEFYSSNETEICIFCHTPHNAAAGRRFLWNKTNTVTTFFMYTGSPTLNFTSKPNVPGTLSRMCMSCHDGAGSVNAMANPRPGVNMQGYDQLGDIYPDDPDNPIVIGWGKNIGNARIEVADRTYGADSFTQGGLLVNDHPISFIYSESQSPADPTINTADGAGGSSIGGLPLWWETIGGASGYRLECVTCHDPHINYNTSCNPGCNGDAAYRPFLRKTMNSSSLCFTCHNK